MRDEVQRDRCRPHRLSHLSRGKTAQIVGICALVGCGGANAHVAPSADPVATTLANLHAFARLYGVVRWFHPSDEAAAADWDRIAIDGVRAVADAPDVSTLMARIERQLAPIAPTLRLARSGEVFGDVPALHPRDTTGLEVVGWQHQGFGDSALTVGEFASKRTHRDRRVKTGGADALFFALSQTVDATPYRGGKIRLRGVLRTAHHGKGRLWLRVDGPEQASFLENMEHRPVIDEHWHPAEIVAPIAPDATRIVFGTILRGDGTVWYDELELASQNAAGSWTPIDIADGGFEANDPLTSWHPGVGRSEQPRTTKGWSVSLDHEAPASGHSALRVEAETRLVREELFSNTPAPGETVDIDLGRFHARVPIALYSTLQHTLGGTGQRETDTSAPPASDGFDPNAGVADVIVVWNALQHFWPYWDLVHVDWNAALDPALRAALANRSVEAHVATLERLLTGAPDGHAEVSCPGQAELASPPFVVTAVPGNVVVTTSEVSELAPGDVVVAIDGRPIADEVAALEAQVSGSPQLRRAYAVTRLGLGAAGTKLTIDVRRGDRELRAELTRVDHDVSATPGHAPIERFDDGVYYLDISRVSSPELAAVMATLATAPGVVVDLRHRPSEAATDLLSHLLVRADDAVWEHVPRIIRPDSASHPAAWRSVGFALPALAPHIAGRVAFLIGAETASYGESIVGLAAHYHLGQLVGTDTAGVNGNVAQLALPTGCSVRFTGERVTRQDGSRFHLLGIPPTIRLEPTVAGIRAHRDEVMERALDYVRTGKK